MTTVPVQGRISCFAIILNKFVILNCVEVGRDVIRPLSEFVISEGEGLDFQYFGLRNNFV